jgi:CRISPR-associated exonuclease Cas4
VTRVYADDDLLPISALQHLAFCERQCALIHIEGLWADNRLTVEGSQLHERVHEDRAPESRGALRIVRGLAIRSYRLGLSGFADVVEFHRAGESGDEHSRVAIPGWPGHWRPLPVEYKRGKPKAGNCHAIQVCAQGLCLEEMLGVTISEGALFYASHRRRTHVPLDAGLRAATCSAAERLHQLISAGVTPRASYEKKCNNCSLIEMCLPSVLSLRRSARAYLARAVEDD